MRISEIIKTLIGYILIGPIVALVLIVIFFCALLPEKYRYDNKLYFFVTYILFKAILLCTFLKIQIKGLEKLPKGSAIFVGNHQSSLDIPVMGYLSGAYPNIWLVLDYYKDAFILGFFVRRMNVTVDQKQPSKSARSLIKIFRLSKDKNRHILIFPEGGRFNDGKIHEFLPGIGALASKLKKPVVPIFMPDNGKIFPPGAFWVRQLPLKVIIGESFYMKDNETEESFVKRLHAWFDEMQKASLKQNV